MALTLEINPKDQRELEAAARQAGRSIADFVVQLFHEAKAARPTATTENVAVLDDWNEVIKSLPDNRAAVGLPPLGDTSRSAEPDLYGYSEREAAQL